MDVPRPMPTTCRAHPDERAGWACDGCGATLCLACVETAKHGWVTVERCRTCLGNARRLTVHRRVVPFSRRVLSAWRYPLAPSGLLATALFAAMHLAGDLVPPLAALSAVLWGYVFWLVRETARGHDEISPPEFTKLTEDILLPSVRALLALAWLVIPVGAWLFVREPNFWLDLAAIPVLLLAGVLYVPIALVMAATGTRTLDLLNPVAGIGYAARLGRDYWILVAAVAIVGVAEVVAELLIGLVPFVGLVLHAFAWVYFPFVMARVLGLLLYTRGDALGYGVPEDYQVPVIPEEPAPVREPGEIVYGADADGRAEVAGAASPPGPTTARIPKFSPAQRPEGWDEPIRDLEVALATRDADQVLSAFDALPTGALGALPGETKIRVGQAASSRGRYELATLVLEAATQTEAQDGQNAAKAWVLLARLHAEKLNQPRRANEIYRFVVRRFPGSAAAQFAEERLTSI